MRRGGALIVALWIIAVLSVMVFSFAYEAHRQASINIFVRERNRVKRLVEPGRIIAEAILIDYPNVKDWEENEREDDLDEEDRFYLEKRDLKKGSCTIGPLLLDEDDEESGTVTITIAPANTPTSNGAGGSAGGSLVGSTGGVCINELYKGSAGAASGSSSSGSSDSSSGDPSYALRWKLILKMSGIHEETEVDVPNPDGSGSTRHNLMNLLIASWNDWRDEDDSVTTDPLKLGNSSSGEENDDGAEKAYYDKLNERLEDDARGKAGRNAAKEAFVTPRNGAIPDLGELQLIRGFRDYPAVLTGGLLLKDVDPDREEDPISNPRLTGLMNMDVFCTSGDAKFLVNNCTTNQLLTIPGIYDKEMLEDEDMDDEDMADAMNLASAIVNARYEKPRNWDSLDEDAGYWDYKDLADLKQRLEDYDGEEDIRNIDLDEALKTAEPYLSFSLNQDKTVFRMTIRAESMGMKHEVVAECYVKDKKVRYLNWRED